MLKFSTWLNKYLFKTIYPKLNMYVAKGAKKHMGKLAGWDETNFLGRDQDREIRLIKNHYETKTEK